MTPAEVAVAAAALCGGVVAGTAAHELLHAATLRLVGVGCRVEFLPARESAGTFRALTVGTWAAVTPERVPDGTPAWGLRVASMAPLSMLAPVVAGVVAWGWTSPASSVAAAAALGWTACALPSPADFAICFRPAEARTAMRERAASDS